MKCDDPRVLKFKPTVDELVLLGRYEPSVVLVDEITILESELGELASKYIKKDHDLDMFYTWTGVAGGYEIGLSIFYKERLNEILECLGEQRFEELTVESRKKCEKDYAEAVEYQKNLAPCTKCGGKRSLADVTQREKWEVLCGNCPSDGDEKEDESHEPAN